MRYTNRHIDIDVLE